MGAAGWTRWVPNRTFIDFGLIFGFHLEIFWALRFEISISFRACIQVTFVPISESKLGRLGRLKPGFRMERIAKNNFSQNMFFADVGVDFGGVTDPKPGGWRW